MRVNGKIYFEEVISAQERDENGATCGSEVVWGEPIPCHIATNQDSRLGRFEDGVFRQAAFTIMVEPEALSQEDLQKRKYVRIRLKRGSSSLGIYSLTEITPIFTQGRVKLVVYNDE